MFGDGVFTADGKTWKAKRTSVIHCLLKKGPFPRAFSVLGHCQYFDNKSKSPPGGGYLKAIDYYHHREGYEKRENCFLRCVKNLTINYYFYHH